MFISLVTIRLHASLSHYVDNNGVRLNCKELLDEFLAAVAKDGRIDLHITGDMSAFLSVPYLLFLIFCLFLIGLLIMS